MPLPHCSTRLLLLFSPSHRLAAAQFTLSARRLRRSTAIRAEPEPPPTSAAEAPDTGAATSEADGEGPVELRASTLFSVDDNPTPLQTATSVLLTGAISVFLFRSLRRRARRARQGARKSLRRFPPSQLSAPFALLQRKTDAFLSVVDCLTQRVRSSGVQKKPNNLSEEALESLRLVSASPIEGDQPPSPVQTLLGGIAAGVIALILYKFTTTIEASLNRQTISDSFSVNS